MAAPDDKSDKEKTDEEVAAEQAESNQDDQEVAREAEDADRKAKAESNRKARQNAKKTVDAQREQEVPEGAQGLDPNGYNDLDQSDARVQGFLGNPIAGGAFPGTADITDADRTPFPPESRGFDVANVVRGQDVIKPFQDKKQ